MKGSRLLKQRLQVPSDDDLVDNLCRVMEICGGHQKLMEMPMSSLVPVLKYLERKQEFENKKMKAMWGGKK